MPSCATFARTGIALVLGGVALAATTAATFGEGRGRNDDSGMWAAIRQDWETRRPMRPNAFRSEPRAYFAVPTERLRPIAPPKAEVAEVKDRYVCVRRCDGAELVLGFGGTGVEAEEYAAMCSAAGAGAETSLVTRALEGGPGVAEDEALAATVIPVADAAASTPGQCPAAIADQPFSVPIEADTTLRAGDVVATAGGFKVFVGSAGSAPHAQASFVDVDDARRLAPQVRRALRKMEVADGG